MYSGFKQSVHQHIHLISILFVFGISLAVYWITLEPTVSLWDCGEFITAAHTLQIPHPPGSPLFLLLGRLLGSLAPQPSLIAYFTNMLSAISSAASVTLLFFIIQLLFFSFSLSRKVAPSTIRFAAMAGALSFAFTDSFWFSATESEVYALSGFFTLLCLWIALLAFHSTDTSRRNKLILLLALLCGLSVNVHMLNLLVIPAIVVLLFPKGNDSIFLWLVKALGAGVALLLLAMVGVVKYSLHIAGLIELQLVNVFHLPVHSGWISFYFFLLLALILLALWFQKKKKIKWNTAILALFFFTLGFSLYFIVIIRSAQAPLMNENAPNTILGLQSYLEREQYGDAPLLRGPSFASPLVGFEKTGCQYRAENGKYIEVAQTTKAIYNPQTLVWFPRMYSDEDFHESAYRSWCNWEGKSVALDGNGKSTTIRIPTAGDNLRFFANYQLGFMYFRYLMWNFAGRQNDMQGNGGIVRGNWLSGFSFIDSPRLGNQSTLPPTLRNESSRACYFLIPILFFLVGLFAMRRLGANERAFVAVWFFTTGIAIAVYLNMTPMQARERDYAFIGSFMAFAVCIAFGICEVAYYWQKLPILKFLRPIIFIGLPVLFLLQNYPGHNRGKRVAARTSALHLLESCPSQAIFFTVGDNETFPLWYLQQVEGIRTDVSLVNSLLLYSPWYLQQINRSGMPYPAVATHFRESDFNNGKFRQVRIARADTTISLREGLAGLTVNAKVSPVLKLNATSVLLKNPFDNSIQPFTFCLPETKLAINELLILDILANNGSQRPLCFSTPSIVARLDLSHRLQPCGLVYCLTSDSIGAGKFNAERWLNVLSMQAYSEGTLDFFNQQQLQSLGYRDKVANTAFYLIKMGHNELAAQLVRSVLHSMPEMLFPQCCNLKLIEALKLSGNKAEANVQLALWRNRAGQELNWFRNLPADMKLFASVEIERREVFLKMNEKMMNTKTQRHEE